MKKIHIIGLLLAITISAIHCGQGHAKTTADPNTAKTDKVTLTIDGKKHMMGEDAVLSLHYVGQQHLELGVISEKEHLQLTVVCFTKELKEATYQVYSCKGPSDCPDEVDAQLQDVLLAPYPIDPVSSVSTARFAYRAASLGLQPLSFVITSVTDDQLAGTPWKTKRVKGHFEGTLAYVDRKGNDWQIIGQPTQLSGEMDMYCSIR